VPASHTAGARVRSVRTVSASEPFDPWKAQVEAFGRYLKTQRQVSDLSLRELARMTNLSNAYISQLERGLHAPSLRVLRALADALGMPLETLLAHTWLRDDGPSTAAAAAATEAAIRGDAALTEAQRDALLAVYRSYVAQGRGGAEP
jgi:transcriptional regulator with XRE-family HTH domain